MVCRSTLSQMDVVPRQSFVSGACSRLQQVPQNKWQHVRRDCDSSIFKSVVCLGTRHLSQGLCARLADHMPWLTAGVVLAEERTATMGITNVVKSLSGACGPLLTGYLASQQLFG